MSNHPDHENSKNPSAEGHPSHQSEGPVNCCRICRLKADSEPRASAHALSEQHSHSPEGDIILVDNNPLDVVRLIKLSKASYRKMQENLVWATGYNIVALPLAAGILAPIGILLSPAIGAVFMSLSTIIAAINARRLRGIDLSA